MMSKWKTVELGDLVTLASGGSFPVKYQGNKDGKYNFFKVSDMNLSQNQKYMVESVNTIDENVKEKLRSKIHPKNTIIFPKVGAALLTNKRRLLVEPSAFDNNIMGVIPNEKVDFNYLYYYMLTVDFRKLSQTGAIPSVNNTIVSLLPVDLPINKIEQQKIAAILSSVDEAIEKTEQIIEQTEKVKKGLMQELLTRGIGHTEFKESPVGRIPQKWEVAVFNDVFDRITTKNSKDNKNVLTISGEHGLISQLEYFNKSVSAKSLTNYIYLENGDFAYNKSYSNGYPLGAIKRLERYEAGVVSTLYICFRLKAPNINGFYKCYFDSPYWHRQVYSIAPEGGRSHGLLNVGVKDFFEILIPVPPVEEQMMIERKLASIDEKVIIEKDRLNNLQTLMQGLMQELLTGKKRVKVDDSEEVLS